MKKLLTIAALVAALTLPAVAHAAAPNVTIVGNVDLGAGSRRITATVDSGTVTGTPIKSGVDPTVTGGCARNYRRKPNGQQQFVGVTCNTPGTVTWTTPYAPPCDTAFTVTATNTDGTSSTSVTIGQPCPPPAPPAIEITVTDGPGYQITALHNPATIPQGITIDQIAPAPDCQYDASAPFTWQVWTRFAGSAPNRYVYYQVVATFDPIAPGDTVYMIRVCP